MSNAEREQKIIIVLGPEGFLKSILSDCFTFLIAITLIGIGHYIGSFAFEWVGVMFFIITLSKSSCISRKFHSADAAIAYIRQATGETA